MKPRRVVVTGIGAVTPIGHGKEGLWEGSASGRCGIRTITRFDHSQLKAKSAGEIDNFDPLDHFEAKIARRMDPFAQYALAATDMAVRDAGLPYDVGRPNPRVGVTVGTALGGVAEGRYVVEGTLGEERIFRAVVFRKAFQRRSYPRADRCTV